MTGSSVIAEIISILTAGITGIATAIGGGLNRLVDKLFFVTDRLGHTSISMFGIMVVVFAGIGLAIGLCRLVVQWLGSLGGRKM